MASWLGQYCINVSDLDRSLDFYTALGLSCTSRTEIPQAFEAILERPGVGGKLQLAQQKDAVPVRMGGMRKLCIRTDGAGETVVDPDGYEVELVHHQEEP